MRLFIVPVMLKLLRDVLPILDKRVLLAIVLLSPPPFCTCADTEKLLLHAIEHVNIKNAIIANIWMVSLTEVL
jgi:hypothetical protein